MMSLSEVVKCWAKGVKNLYDPYPIRRFMRKRRCIFVHIPKNGGTSILNALGAGANRMHVPWDVYRQSNRFLYDQFFKFAIIRNPFDRTVSLFSYLSQGGSHKGTDNNLSKLVKERYPTFDSFVNEFLEPSSLHLHALLRPQAFWVFDYSGRCMVDSLYPLETLNSAFPEILSKLKMKETSLSVANRSDRTHFSDYYSAETKQRILELYDCDFRLLGYSTDSSD